MIASQSDGRRFGNTISAGLERDYVTIVTSVSPIKLDVVVLDEQPTEGLTLDVARFILFFDSQSWCSVIYPSYSHPLLVAYRYGRDRDCADVPRSVMG